MSFNKTIQMIIFDNNPNGMIMCELSNWNGRVFKVARAELNSFYTRNESVYTGVYFLFGRDDDNNETIYIGEAENMQRRLKQHLNDANYWNDVIVVISKDNILNKAHVKYLENLFYSLAINSGRATIVNSNVPTKSSVSEYDEAMLEEFISNSKLLVNTLGYKVFDTIEETTVKDNNRAEIKLYIKTKKGADAAGSIVADGFVVYRGSKVSATFTKSFTYHKQRDKLIENRTIDENFTFSKDYIFSSPSTAASIVMGRNANGLTEWVTQDGVSLKHLQEE
ncbi:GIY-YIG nuclease family protein [Ruminococcus difficilis]|uniref:GIY-YIG nuclease family protein n=1 Tax=Ruminococcus difficilis TaxID=2763069 RepID=A0A934WPN9_9FIRM|nr:GIY-YIG nuclease family protein [Ruminococcus difficilis]MBK6088506.1 GIY-YIG nuclease family protein [Ruminococcus difficilis]